jgi:hypothetical protein
VGVSECQTTPVCASIHPASTKSQPPPSATNSGVAEDGGYSPLKGDSNLRHRRNNQGFAEHGRYTHRKGFPNLHHRRPTNHSPKTDVKRHSQPAQPPPSATNPGFAEHGSYRPLESVPNLRHRRNNQRVADDGRYTPQKWIPNLHLRRPTDHSPNTEDTALRRIPNLPH